jgi:hypothetical protein
MANSARGGHGAKNAPTPAPTTYSDFAATHPPLFTEAGEPLEAYHWLQVIESKFGLLHCTEMQKTLFATQQLHGGPTTPPLAPRTTRFHGPSSTTLSTPTTSQQA